jgi:ABC-type xylose transport system permease subunit
MAISKKFAYSLVGFIFFWMMLFQFVGFTIAMVFEKIITAPVKSLDVLQGAHGHMGLFSIIILVSTLWLYTQKPSFLQKKHAKVLLFYTGAMVCMGSGMVVEFVSANIASSIMAQIGSVVTALGGCSWVVGSLTMSSIFFLSRKDQ